MSDAFAALIVEDDVDAREVLFEWFAAWGFIADTVQDAESALEMLNEHSYDVMIIDLALPGIDGMELVQQLRAAPQTTNMPCIAITAFGNNAVKHHVFEAGFDAYLPKPLVEDDMYETLKQLPGFSS